MCSSTRNSRMDLYSLSPYHAAASAPPAGAAFPSSRRRTCSPRQPEAVHWQHPAAETRPALCRPDPPARHPAWGHRPSCGHACAAGTGSAPPPQHLLGAATAIMVFTPVADGIGTGLNPDFEIASACFGLEVHVHHDAQQGQRLVGNLLQ